MIEIIPGMPDNVVALDYGRSEVFRVFHSMPGEDLRERETFRGEDVGK
jgi:hypothetical protein